MIVKDLVRHVLRLFTHEAEERYEPIRQPSRADHPRQNLATVNATQHRLAVWENQRPHVPVISSAGVIVAFQEVSESANSLPPVNPPPIPTPVNTISPAEPNLRFDVPSNPSSTVDGPITPQQTGATIVPTIIPPDKSPTASEFTGDIRSVPVPLVWDGQPDGDWDYLFTWAEYKRTNNLQTLYVTKNNTQLAGPHNAPTWNQGYISRRVCRGVLKCGDSMCRYVVRPHTSDQRIHSQLKTQACECGKPLKQVTCPAIDFRARFKGGCFYRHRNKHSHPVPPIKTPLPWQLEAFEEVVQKHPDATPSQLRAGIATPWGGVPPVSDISPAFINSNRISYHRNQVLRLHKQPSGGDDFVEQIQKFNSERPDFIQEMTFIPHCVISVQSPWMLLQSAHDNILDGPLNGIVTDGAHGFWGSRNAVLQVSSVYHVQLQRWIPVLMSYLDGHSAHEFRLHFLSLFRGIALVVQQRGLGKLENHLATVMDFSQAQREGFLLAFIDLYTELGDERDDVELREAGQALLKGCAEHFRQALTRASNIHAVIGTGSHDDFVQRTLQLTSSTEYEDFERIGRGLYKDYPQITNFLDWWLNPIRAMMIIKSQRAMEEDLWTSLPDTTNGAEGGHWSIYCTVGTKHSLLSGLEALDRVSQTLERQAKSVEVGQRTRYGSKMPRERVYHQSGRTKLSRDPRNSRKIINDGRAPDTRKALQGKKKPEEHVKAADSSASKHFGLLLFSWDKNSCWVDVGLLLLDVALARNWKDFENIAECFLEDHAIREVFLIIKHIRHLREATPHDITEQLAMERDALRDILLRERIIDDIGSFGRVFGWLSDLFYSAVREEQLQSDGRALPFFAPLYADFHECSGSPSTFGRHLQVTPTLRPLFDFQLGAHAHETFEGKLVKWFDHFIAPPKPTAKECWRFSDTAGRLCSGTHTDHNRYIVSLPVVLIIEFEQDDAENPLQWNIPTVLKPGHPSLIKAHGLIYEIIGISEVSGPHQASHFTARFVHDNAVYAYNDMVREGRALALKNKEVKTHLAGHPPKLLAGHAIHHVVYVLRGGLQAQQAFYESRATAIKNRFKFQLPALVTNSTHLQYLEPTKLVSMSADCRTWIQNPQNRLKFSEYVHPSLINIRVVIDAPTISSMSAESEEPTVVREPIDLRLDTRSPSLPAYPVLPPRIRPPATRYQSVTSSDGDRDSILFKESDDERNPTNRIHCRCGVRGNVEDVLTISPEEGELVFCSHALCDYYTHAACIPNGYDPEKKWYCETCMILAPKEWKSQQHSVSDLTNRRTLTTVWRVDKPKPERLRPGVGALCRLGIFWYPVRLLRYNSDNEQWLVQWWRGCIFSPTGPLREPDGMSWELESDITDAEWDHQSERRNIRLGLWDLTNRIEPLEDYLVKCTWVKYTSTMDQALQPHLSTLKLLVNNPDTLDDDDIPVLKAARRTKANSFDSFVVDANRGALTLRENAAISNWLHVHLGNSDSKNQMLSFNSLANAHARTLWCASILQAQSIQSRQHTLDEVSILSKAWDLLGSTGRLHKTDVNKEAVCKLEQLMFEVSWGAGKAGDKQWGLNEGDHQAKWNPYNFVTPGWIQKKDTELDSDARVRGWNYKSIPLTASSSEDIKSFSRPIDNPSPKEDYSAPSGKRKIQRKRKGSMKRPHKKRRE